VARNQTSRKQAPATAKPVPTRQKASIRASGGGAFLAGNSAEWGSGGEEVAAMGKSGEPFCGEWTMAVMTRHPIREGK